MRGSIRKRGDSWELTVELPSSRPGKRERKFITVKGTKAEAERRLREIGLLVDRGLPIDTGRTTFATFLEQWLRDYVVPNDRPRTVERYESDIRLHIGPALGHIQVKKLTVQQVQAFEAKLIKAGKSRNSVRHIHAVLRKSLKHALQWGFVSQNVTDHVQSPKPGHYEAQQLDPKRIWKILELARSTPYHTAFCFLAFSGCRRGEALGLRWDDLDLENRTASIVRSLQRLKGQGLVLQPPKSAKSRRAISIDEMTVDMLRQHRGQQLLYMVELGDLYEDSGFVFPGPTGRALDPSVLTRNFERLAKAADATGARLHDLRHAHATLLLQEGTHPKVVQERLGHESSAFTLDRYSHVMPALQDKAAADFASAMERARRHPDDLD